MNPGLRFFVAMVSASFVAPALFAVYVYSGVPGNQLNGFWFVVAIAWLVCLAHLLLIGAPVFMLLRRRDKLKLETVSISGFLAGVLPLGFLMYPSRHEGYSSSANWHGTYATFYENGEPTRYAWLSHIESSLVFGSLGAVAAVVLWRVWAVLGSEQADHAADA